MRRLDTREMIYPDCLPVDESLTCLAFDDDSPERLYLGGVNGTIAELDTETREARLSWMLPSQAIVSSTSEHFSLGSIILSPRKTSLWTSALSDRHVALGCDRNVLLAPMPDNSSNAQEMRSLPTGGKGGGGAVFALEIVHETIIAGTRKGQVKIFDARDSAKASSVQSIKLTSSVTNVRTVPGTESYVVVAAMDGSLATYDLRLLKRDAPVQSYRGHDNSYMRDLGFDVTKDHVLAADQHGRFRCWETTSGRLVRLFQGEQESPIKALVIHDLDVYLSAGPAVKNLSPAF